MVELVDTLVLETSASQLVGSSPTLGTNLNKLYMKMFEQVRVPDSRKGNDYIVTAEINQVAYEDREGPYLSLIHI